tara:strand:- start:76 stop:1398 length:1323 start_codon:yes stop_codon:yes gene_type:complete
MPNIFVIKKKIKDFKNKIIKVNGDKSLSIRWVLLASLAEGRSKSFNLLLSEDVKASINSIKRLGIKVKLNENFCEIHGKGLNGYKYKSNIVLNAKNSGTLGRLILGLLVNSTKKMKLIGDKSLSKRDFKRISDPLQKFGAKFKLTKNRNLPLSILGTTNLKPIKYYEKKGSAQCKSSVIFAALRTEGTTFIKAKKSRNHTELLCKHLKLPITLVKKRNYDLIKVKKAKKIRSFNYNIPSDISSAAFFIILTCLRNNSSMTINNVNINPSRIGIIYILKKMGAKIIFKNKKKYRGEQIADIFVKSPKNLKSINCPVRLNSSSIDEFLLIFLVAAKAKGISYFKDLGELNKKESPRLKWGSRILNLMGVKNQLTSSSIKIFGNPGINLKKKITIKNFLKDHRVFMSSVIAALSFGGEWHIHDKNSIKTSFPDFLKILKNLQK